MPVVMVIILGVIFLTALVNVIEQIDCKHLTYTKNQTLNKILMKQCIGLDIGEGD